MSRRTLIIIGTCVVVGLVALLVVTRSRKAAPTPVSPSPTSNVTIFPDITPDTPLFSPTPLTTASPGMSNTCLVLRAELTDSDLDSLPDILESAYGTNVNVADTDGDGATDGEEVRSGHDPRAAGGARLDSDGDLLLEHEECEWNTDPANPDTDRDGFTDGMEVRNCYDPATKGDGQGSDKLPSCSSSLPTISPTPTVPVSSVVPTNVPPRTTLPKVRQSELEIITDTSAAAVRAYLAATDAVPAPFGPSGELLIQAFQSAISGNAQELTNVRAKLRTYERALLAIPVPRNALPYHELHIALTRYVYEKLGVMERAVGKNFATMEQAARDIMTELPPYIADLQTKRAALESIAVSAQ